MAVMIWGVRNSHDRSRDLADAAGLGHPGDTPSGILLPWPDELIDTRQRAAKTVVVLTESSTERRAEDDGFARDGVAFALLTIADPLRDTSRATLHKFRQNLFCAFNYNVFGIPLAALGMPSPVIAGAAMAISSVPMVSNSLLLKRWLGRQTRCTQQARDPENHDPKKNEDA